MSTRWIADDLLDRDVLDRHGDRIGRIERVFLDAESSTPSFVAINTGLLSRSPSVVPLAGAVARGEALVLPLDRERVKGAPTVQPAGRNGGLSLGQERALHTFYDVAPDTTAAPDAGHAARTTDAAGTERATGAPDDAMTRSEEHLRVHTEDRPVARARLRKHVVTEEVQVTVPVTREEFRVEYEPITDDEPTQHDAAPSDNPTEPDAVTLHSERVVVRTETVPTERVRLATDRVTEQQTVEGQVRREKIDVEEPD